MEAKCDGLWPHAALVDSRCSAMQRRRCYTVSTAAISGKLELELTGKCATRMPAFCGGREIGVVDTFRESVSDKRRVWMREVDGREKSLDEKSWVSTGTESNNL